MPKLVCKCGRVAAVIYENEKGVQARFCRECAKELLAESETQKVRLKEVLEKKPHFA